MSSATLRHHAAGYLGGSLGIANECGGEALTRSAIRRMFLQILQGLHGQTKGLWRFMVPCEIVARETEWGYHWEGRLLFDNLPNLSFSRGLETKKLLKK